MKLSAYIEDYDNDKVLLTGLPKAGKSTLAAELAEEFNLYWIDTEKGIKTLMKLPAEWQERINVCVLPDSASYPIAAETLAIFFKTGKMNVCQLHGKHDCAICKKSAPNDFTSWDLSQFTKKDILVLDTSTQLGYSILAHVTRNKPVDYKPERDDWGSLRKFTEFFASQFQALKCNFVCISHIVESEMEDGKTKLVPAFGSKGMSASFAKAFDHVIYIEQKNGRHVAGSMTNYSGTVLTGSRTDFDITKELGSDGKSKPSLIPIFTGAYGKNKELTPAETALANISKLS